MKNLKSKLEILRQGADDSLNLLDPNMMDHLNGGTICKRDYCTPAYVGGNCIGRYCKEDYDSSKPKPTPSPTPTPTPTDPPALTLF